MPVMIGLLRWLVRPPQREVTVQRRLFLRREAGHGSLQWLLLRPLGFVVLWGYWEPGQCLPSLPGEIVFFKVALGTVTTDRFMGVKCRTLPRETYSISPSLPLSFSAVPAVKKALCSPFRLFEKPYMVKSECQWTWADCLYPLETIFAFEFF